MLAGGVNYNFRVAGHESSILVSEASGPWLTTQDGRHFFDLFSAFGAQAFPHGCEEYAEGMRADPLVFSGSLPSVWVEEACSALLELFPHHSTIRFCVTGTEAAQLASRLARAATQRVRILRFDGHYHGHADALLGGQYSLEEFPIPLINDGDPRATRGATPAAVTGSTFIARWNSFSDTEEIFGRYGSEIAGILVEPFAINAEGSGPAPGFLQLLRRLCDEYGAILIYDEIITGFRAGLGGWQATDPVRPDVTLLGKMLGGGAVPVSAVLTSKDLLGLCSDFLVVHGGTFNGYPLGANAVRHTIDLLTAPGPLSMASLQTSGTRLWAAVEGAIKGEALPVSLGGLPGAMWLLPETGVAEGRSVRATTVHLLRRYLLGAGILPAMPTRCYVTAGLSADEVDSAARRMVAAFRAFRDHLDEAVERD